jgi:hypothetical protein
MMSSAEKGNRRMGASHLYHRPAPQRRTQHHRLLALPLIAGGIAVVAAGAFIAHVLWPGWQGAPIGLHGPALPVTVAGVAFNVPPAAIRVPLQRQPGAHERLDLAFQWPSLQPPDAAALPNIPSKGVSQSFERVFVTITPARNTLAPADRVKTIYPRYAEAEPSEGPEGLAVIAFRQGTPYQGEDLIYDATMPNNFLVRCSRSGAGPTPGVCLYIRRIGEADVTVRFQRDWLEDWRSITSAIEELIAKLRPPGG